MGTDMGTARDEADTSAAEADEIIRLIMSGQRPKVVADAPGDTAAAPATRPVGISPVDADPFWAAPPSASLESQPRVEAIFTRGVNYETPESVAIETDDISSIGEEETFVAELAPSPTVEPRADEVEAVSLESTAQESAPLAEVTDAAASERKASSFRPLPTPQSRMLGADFVRDTDRDEAIDPRCETEQDEA